MVATLQSPGSMDRTKKPYVPLEEALDKAGVGLYTNYMMVVTGMVLLSAVLGVQVMAVVLPKAGCELNLSSLEKGVLTSSSFAGMTLASFIFGFLADRYGRRKVMLYCSASNVCLSLLASIAPDHFSLIAVWLLNGLMLGGVFTPGLVLVSELCPQRVRARSVLIPTGLSSLAFVYLPCMAWIIFPLDLSVELFFGVVFTPWRLYVAHIAIPTALTWLLLFRLPDSPKFVLNQGDEEGTLRILRSIYAGNNRKTSEEYPVEHVCLDPSDLASRNKTADDTEAGTCGSRLNRQIADLFTPPLLFYSALSISVLFGAIGVFNVLFLWYPEQVRVLMHHYDNEMEYNATICDVMAAQFEDTTNTSCDLDEDIFVVGMITALLQCALYLIISIIADKVGRKLLVILIGGLSCGTFIGLIFANTFFLTVGSLSVTIILLSVLFPLCFSIFIDFFPTSLRSTASSVMMLFGRFATAGGSQIFGAMFENYCRQAYWGLASILVGSFVLTILMPTKRTSQL